MSGHGLVLGKFYPFHSGHSHLIRRAQRDSDRVTVQVLGASVESIPVSYTHLTLPTIYSV